MTLPLTPPAPAPAAALRAHATDALAHLIRLYLEAQPRDLRRSILTAGRVMGWRLDRSTASDLVDQLDDAALRYFAASAYDWVTDALGLDLDTLDVDTTNPAAAEHAHAQLGAALARAAW